MNNEIIKEDFQKYENVRSSGKTNMLNIRNVEILSGLSKEKIKKIISNYSYYKEKFEGDENE